MAGKLDTKSTWWQQDYFNPTKQVWWIRIVATPRVKCEYERKPEFTILIHSTTFPSSWLGIIHHNKRNWDDSAGRKRLDYDIEIQWEQHLNNSPRACEHRIHVWDFSRAFQWRNVFMECEDEVMIWLAIIHHHSRNCDDTIPLPSQQYLYQVSINQPDQTVCWFAFPGGLTSTTTAVISRVDLFTFIRETCFYTATLITVWSPGHH